jgi:NTP pyrophosphatase (non-canonical NTP hydrolase)
MKHFNQLGPAEAERLSLLLEECGEVIQIVGKIQRHGYESFNPNDASATTNRALLERELGDLRHALSRMCFSGDVNEREIGKHQESKAKRIGPYLHHQWDGTSANANT